MLLLLLHCCYCCIHFYYERETIILICDVITERAFRLPYVLSAVLCRDREKREWEREWRAANVRAALANFNFMT